jgi:hypothetical protein
MALLRGFYKIPTVSRLSPREIDVLISFRSSVRKTSMFRPQQAAHDLLARFPDVHDGYDRLGMVCEARGDHRQAADYYRKAINVIRNHPDIYDPAFEGVFQKIIDRLEPKADAAAD